MFDLGHALPPDISAKKLATRDPLLAKYTTDDNGNRMYQFVRCTVCGLGVYHRDMLPNAQIKSFIKDHGNACSAHFDSVRYIFDPAGFEPVQKRNRKPKTSAESTETDVRDVAPNNGGSAITWTLQSLSQAYPGLVVIDDDEEIDSDDDEESRYEKEIVNSRNAKLREGTLTDETIRYMFDGMMRSKKYQEALEKRRQKQVAKPGPDPKYIEALTTISNMESQKLIMEDKIAKMEQRMKELQEHLENETKKQACMEEAVEEYGLRDTVLERAQEIARAFRQ
jgi:hypothetical protein